MATIPSMRFSKTNCLSFHRHCCSSLIADRFKTRISEARQQLGWLFHASFRRFNYQNQQWFQNIYVSQTHIQQSIFKFNSFNSEEYKVGLIFTLFGTFSVVSDFSRFHSEVCHLKEILKKERISYHIDRQLHQKLSQ